MNLTDTAFSGLPKRDVILNPNLESGKPRPSENPGISYAAATRGMQKILDNLQDKLPTNK